MKKCDCIWVLAPIQRAVDNQSAKNLLGDAFRMQLMSEYPLWQFQYRLTDSFCSGRQVSRGQDEFLDYD